MPAVQVGTKVQEAATDEKVQPPTISQSPSQSACSKMSCTLTDCIWSFGQLFSMVSHNSV